MHIQLIVMGVSGCGKSTIGQALAHRWSLPFLEGDGFHSERNVAKMADGIALTDEDRWPWLDRIGEEMVVSVQSVASCSALRKDYRDRLRASVGPNLKFAMIDLPREILMDRMVTRPGHYMPASLLDSQLATLERPTSDESDVLIVDGSLPVEVVADHISSWMIQ